MTVCVETYGCRMNVWDSEIIMTILKQSGYEIVSKGMSSDVIILNSCSVREVGHNKIYERLESLSFDERTANSWIIIAGCFANLISDEVYKQYPNVKGIVNANCYKYIPQMLRDISETGQVQCRINKDNHEMYEDVLPYRFIEGKTTAAIIVMKGCNQHCTYCIEPFTRGSEKCRSVESIVLEARHIVDSGFKEITLVGHLIDNYFWIDARGHKYDFSELLKILAEAYPSLRIKYLSSHPLYYSESIMKVVKRYPNIMRVVHLPVQSGSDRILRMMNRGYPSAFFIEKIEQVRSCVPNMTIVTDVMVGFCSETEEDFEMTIQLIRTIKPDFINVFEFSLRPYTLAHEQYIDDISAEIKKERAQRVIQLGKNIRIEKLQREIGTEHWVIAEGEFNNSLWYGRNNKHQLLLFHPTPNISENSTVRVRVVSVCEEGLMGEIISR